MTTEAKSPAKRKFTTEYKRALVAEIAFAPHGGQKKILAREKVDRVIVTFHWGIPYDHQPLPEDREKARLAIAAGADAVIGHHPHVLQPFEIHRGRPIFYSVGNYAFGSGNSRAEGMLVGLRFGEHETTCRLFPLYVKNRDPRVNYQPRVLRGIAGTHLLTHLSDLSGESGQLLRIENGWGLLVLPI